MKNPTQEVLAAAVADRLAGMKAKDILAKHGLSHSQFEFAWLRLHEMADVAGTVEPTAKNVVRLRAEGQSWGRIAVLTGLSEGKVRTTFKEATGAKSQGQRIGKGGRWLYNDQTLYEAEFNKPGTTIPANAPEFRGSEGARQANEAQRNLITADIKDVIAEFKKATGRKSANGLTKVQMITAILAAEKAEA